VTASPIGFAFVDALARRDRSGMVRLLDPHVEFRALTPGRDWRAEDATTVVQGIILGTWFDGVDEDMTVVSLAGGSVGERHAVDYELNLTRRGEPYRLAQHACFDVSGGRITWMRVLCSGYQPGHPGHASKNAGRQGKEAGPAAPAESLRGRRPRPAPRSRPAPSPGPAGR